MKVVGKIPECYVSNVHNLFMLRMRRKVRLVPGCRVEIAAGSPGGVEGVDLLNEGVGEDVILP